MNSKGGKKKAKTLESDGNKTQEKYTLFYKKDSPFSQHYPVTFTVNETVYNCAEQYMMHQKAGTINNNKMGEYQIYSSVVDYLFNNDLDYS